GYSPSSVSIRLSWPHSTTSWRLRIPWSSRAWRRPCKCRKVRKCDEQISNLPITEAGFGRVERNNARSVRQRTETGTSTVQTQHLPALLAPVQSRRTKAFVQVQAVPKRRSVRGSRSCLYT